MIILCQCSFINCNKCTTEVGDIDNERGYACVGARGIWEISVTFAQFCCEPKIALKIKSLKRKKVYTQTVA